MDIAGYIKTSLVEWPGKISSVIFVPGCNFCCPFCHNGDLVLEREFTRIPEKRIFADLEKKRGLVDGVVVTGGEPTLQKDFEGFLRKTKEMGFLNMVETNGTKPEVIAKLFTLQGLNCLPCKGFIVDCVAMDLKGDLENYEKYTNVKCTIYNVQKSIALIANSGVEYEFRTTVVPGLHSLENLVKLAKQLRNILNTKYLILNTKWYLQQFRPLNCLDEKFLKVKPFSKQEMEKIHKEVRKIIPSASLRGL